MKTFQQLKLHMLGMSKEEWGENSDRILLPAVEEICKKIITITIPSITITITINLKYYFLFIKFILLLYKFLGGDYALEWYTSSGVIHI